MTDADVVLDAPHATVRPSVWAEVANVRRELRQRRLRLHDMPPVARYLARAALLAALVAAVLLAVQPLIENGESGFHHLTLDGDPARISVLGSIVVFLGCAAAFGLAAYAAPERWRRLVAAGAAMGGLIMLPTDFGNPLQSWLMFAALSAIVLLVCAAVIGIPRSRHTLAVLAVAAPLATLGAIALSAGIVLTPEQGPDANLPNRLATLTALHGVASLTGLFVALGIWGVIEGTRALSRSATATLVLPRRWWLVVPLLAALKLLWMVAVSAGVLSIAVPKVNAGAALTSESWLSLALAAGFVVLISLAALRGWFRPASAGVATGAFWMLVIPIIAAYVMPQLGISLVGSGYRFALRLHQPIDAAALAAWTSDVTAAQAWALEYLSRTSDLLLTAAPLISSLTALAVAALLWTRHRERAMAAPFFAAFGAWTLIPAASWALLELGVPIWDQPPDATGAAALFGNVHPVTIDAGITMLVLIGSLVALRSDARMSPPLLLALLVTSTVAAYGNLLTPETWAALLFWIGLASPLFIQFGFDASKLNTVGSNRSARVLFALAAALLTVAVTYAALLAGYASPESSSTTDLVRQLAVLPLGLTFVLALAGPHSGTGDPTPHNRSNTSR